MAHGVLSVMSEIRPGYYQDQNGVWQVDRRKTGDRRGLRKELHHRDRRQMSRRKADQEFLERDQREMIEDALNDFAAEHEGHI